MTKNDLYSFLITAGIKRGYEVIPEFALYPANIEGSNARGRNAKIDLVWASRKGHRRPQDQVNHEYWNLHAVFEIEGCNVRRLPNELLRHEANFQRISKLYGRAIPSFVVLYTAAYDRGFDNTVDRATQVASRLEWGADLGIVTLDGRNIKTEIDSRFPTAIISTGERELLGR